MRAYPGLLAPPVFPRSVSADLAACMQASTCLANWPAWRRSWRRTASWTQATMVLIRAGYVPQASNVFGELASQASRLAPDGVMDPAVGQLVAAGLASAATLLTASLMRSTCRSAPSPTSSTCQCFASVRQGYLMQLLGVPPTPASWSLLSRPVFRVSRDMSLSARTPAVTWVLLAGNILPLGEVPGSLAGAGAH